MFPRRSVSPTELDAYIQRTHDGPCFICELIVRNPEYPHHVIHEDETAIVFLNKYPVLFGHTLVAPRHHYEQVTGDFSLEGYLALQQVVFRVSEAIRRVVPTERMYLYSLGSQQGNKHVHWHITPLPPGTPYHEQQMEALNIGRGILQVPDDEMASLATRIRQAL